ncbi:GGDEF domain-containing protein [Spirochaetota bacterium]
MKRVKRKKSKSKSKSTNKNSVESKSKGKSKSKKTKEKELNQFQVNCIRILTHLLEKDAVEDRVVDTIYELELDYFSLLKKSEILEKKLNVDNKTNLLKYNKSYLDEILKTVSRFSDHIRKLDRYSISYIRIDIDDFSLFNNKYGHEEGDVVLIELAKVLHDISRPTDYCIRFGGEEFDIILPSTTLAGATKYMDRVYQKINNLSLSFGDKDVSVTISAGISTNIWKYEEIKKSAKKGAEEIYTRLQKEVDDALYEAKNLGKNRYCIYDGSKNYQEIRDDYIKNRSKLSTKR